MTFAALELSPALLRAVRELGYRTPTPVQVAAIPAIMSGKDAWVSAKTGSGKTAAFVLPLLARFERKAPEHPRPIFALVLAPTRELAVQIAEAVDALGGYLARAPKTCVAIGGVSLSPQMLALRGGADVVVATPGRLLDLIAKNALSLAWVEALVLDEADRLLSLGFGDELAQVLALLPVLRQNVLLSATFPPAVKALAEKILHAPARINVDAGSLPAADVIAQRAIEVDADKRTMLLRHLLAAEGWSQVLVFVSSRHGAERVADKLTRARIAARALHGDLSQGARTQALADFKAKRVNVLVATDVAARGLDVAELPAVVNYDLPRSAPDYLHRIGRTGRAGEKGIAVSFVSAETEAHFRLIEKRNRVSVPRERLEGFVPVNVTPLGGDPHGGVKGKRKSKKDKLREAAARGNGGNGGDADER